MAEELSNVLIHGRAHAHLSPEALELMGKKAANLFLDQGVTLDEGVAKLAAQHDDINAEQIKRICEFANSATYLSFHDKHKTAGASSSYPQFKLADPARVIQNLSDGARPTVITPVDIDYGRQPEKAKTSSAKIDRALEQLFETKKAGVDLPFTKETAYKEVVAARDMLEGLEDNLSNAYSQFDSMFKEASLAWYSHVKHHLLSGGSFVDILNAGRATEASSEKIASLLEPHIEQLLVDGVSTAEKISEQSEDFSKTAHRLVDTNHPFVKTFKAMVDLDVEIEKTSMALEQVHAQQKTVRDFMKEQFSASTSR